MILMDMQRIQFVNEISVRLKQFPVTCLLGPRQSGKTTLARQVVQHRVDDFERTLFLDLEDPTDEQRLTDPKLFLSGLRGLVIIDEVQRKPELFPLLRVLVDRPNNPLRFLLLGSASRELIQQSSESLAGRIGYLEITPFGINELPTTSSLDELWYRGGFPLSYLASSDEESVRWRNSYIRTFLEQDIPNLGIQIPAATLRRFWLMLTHYHGQSFNSSEIASSLGVSDTTARRYLDILSGTFMIRQLSPWIESIAKRQIKSPKIYFRDSGILHALLDLRSKDALHLHPKLGASWEGFALEQIIRTEAAENENVFFWGVHQQSELDLLIIKSGKRLGFEIKHTAEPKVTKSMRTAIELLGLDHLTIVFRGDGSFPLAERISARSLSSFRSAAEVGR